MKDEVKKKLSWYAKKVEDGKSEPMSKLEKRASDAIIALLMGKEANMNINEALRIMDGWQAKPDMTDQEWLDLEEEYTQFFRDNISAEDMKEYSGPTVGDMLPMICAAIRAKREKQTIPEPKK